MDKEQLAQKRESVTAKLKLLARSNDTAVAHGDADDYLVEFLYALGEKELVDAYRAVPKWYA